MENRILGLAGVHNFRDYGGYATRHGGRVRSGVLFRSGQHRDATSADLDRIRTLRLATIIDLRGDGERGLYPCRRHPTCSAAVVFAPGETAGHAPHIEAARDVRTKADADTAMIALYRSMPFRPVLVATMRLYLRALAEGYGPSLIHCLAGKDRTGLAVALLHHALGVGRDDIYADYELTNQAGNAEARIAAGADHVRAGFGPAMEDAALRALMGVDAAYLDAGFAEIVARHGDVDEYLRDVLEVDAGMRERLNSKLMT